MSRRKIKAGSTSQILPVFIQDTSSTTGAGLGSLVYNTASLAAKYRRQGDSSWTTISLVTATAGTFTSGGFVADGGSVTGGYELGLPNAMIASGATWAQLQIYGAANMLPVLVEFELDAIDYQNATNAGLAGIPNVASGSAGGLIVQGTGITGLDVTSGVVKANLTQILGTVLTETAGYLAAGFKKFFNVSATPTSTMDVIGTVTNLTNAPTAGDFTATMKSSITTAATAATPIAASVSGNVGGNVVGTVGSVVGAVGSVTGNVGGNVTGSVGSIATGGIVAASFGTDSITSTALAASAVSEIQSGLMLASSYTAPLDAAGVRNAVGLASANLDTQLADLPTNSELTTALGTLNDLSSAEAQAATAAALLAYGAPTTVDIPTAAAISSQVQTDLGTGSALTSLASQVSVNTLTGYVDTEVVAIKAKTDNLPAAPAAVGDIPTANENATAYLTLADGVEAGLTPQQVLRVIFAALSGKVAGAGTNTMTFRNYADTKDRITAETDSSGNRLTITLDLT